MAELQFESEIKKVAAHLKKLRVDSGYTSYETFAYDHELPRMQYWRMESGVNFRFSSLLVILKVHNLTLQEFAKGAGI